MKTTDDAWRREPLTWAAIAIALLLWASAFAGIRAGLESYGPGQVALLRFATASAVFFVYASITRMRPPDPRDIPRIALAGLLGITTYHVALNFGEVTVTAGAASLIISASPIITALLSVLLIGERLSVAGWIGIVVSFLGVVLISVGEGGHLAFEPRAALVFLAATGTALYFVVAKRPLRRYSAVQFTAYAVWAGTLPMLVFAPGLISQMATATPAATWAVLYMGVFPGAVAYALWSYALARMPASVLSTFIYFQPVNAIIIAWVWLGEVPSLLALVGGTVSLVGVAIVNTRGRGRPEPVVAPVTDE